MNDARTIVRTGGLLALIMMMTGCIVAPAPSEGYYDHNHHRYYHDHDWHDCGDHSEYCR